MQPVAGTSNGPAKFSYNSCVVCKRVPDTWSGVTFHRCPRTPYYRTQWQQFAGSTLDSQVHGFQICSEHFTEQDFLDGRNLLPNAVPSIKNPGKHKRRSSLEIEEEERKKRKQEVERILSESSARKSPEPTTSQPSLVTTTPVRKKVTTPTRKVIHIVDDESSLEAENRALRARIAELEQLLEKKNEKIALAKTEMLSITAALQDLKDLEARNLTIKVNEVLKEFLTENQVRVVATGGEVEWNDQEVENALVLRTAGPDHYEFLRTELRYPLPTSTELEQWIKNSYLQRGLQTHAFGALKVLGRSMEERDKECVLLLGRLRTNVEYTYDPERDQVIDNNGYLYCICAQGLLSNWHQIIYLEFDLICSADLLGDLMGRLHDIQFNVAAISGTCDLETIDLWGEFDVSPENPFVKHPKTNAPVYMMACAISTFSAIHKVLVGEGFTVQDDVQFDKSLLEQLVNADDGLGGVLPVTSQHLLHDQASSELNTQLAEELISYRTASALRLHSEHGEESMYATLFELFRDWYDLLTTPLTDSDHIYDATSQVTHLQFGASLDEQNIVLDGMYDTVSTLHCTSDQDEFLPQCILVSINSLRKLLTDLQFRYDNVLIPTLTLTSHSLATLFKGFQLVADHPGALSVNRVLHQLSLASIDYDHLAVTSQLLERTFLNGEFRPVLQPDPTPETAAPNVAEKQACEYITRYIANELRPKYDYLGDQTFRVERQDNKYVVKPEVPKGKIEPSKLWTDQARKLENYISDITFFKNEGVIENVVSSIFKRHPKMAADIIRLYVEQRLAIKLRNLNKGVREGV